MAGFEQFFLDRKLISGELASKSACDAIVEALENYLRGKTKPGGLYRA